MPAEWILLYALLAVAPSMADDAPPEPAPPVEMLEFLGDWQTAKGESVDPAQFADTTTETDKPSEDKQREQHK